MKVLICDDIEEEVNNVKDLLISFTKINAIGFEIETSLVPEKVYSNFYDIAFIDIEMPGLNGLNLASKLKMVNPNVIVVVITSFQSYLDDAMRIHVFRYLSKPIDKARFYNCLNDAVKEYYSINKKITFYTNNEFQVCYTSNILYIETEKNGCTIHTVDSDISCHKKVREIYEMINQKDKFVYSHNSILVNLDHVVKFNNTTVFIKKNDSEIISTYISQRKYSSFKRYFFNYIGGSQ